VVFNPAVTADSKGVLTASIPHLVSHFSRKNTQKVMFKKPKNLPSDSTSKVDKIIINPQTKVTNIAQVMKQLDNYVQENFTTLSNCITTFKLPSIDPPSYPTLSNQQQSNPTTSTTSKTKTMKPNTKTKKLNTKKSNTKKDKEEDSSDESSKSEEESEESEEEDEEDEDEEDVAPLIDEINNAPLQDPNVPDAVKLAMYTTLFQQYTIRVQDRADELSQLYGIIQSSLSPGSKNEVKAHKQYIKVKNSRNGLEFWKIVYETHRTTKTQYTNKTKYKEDTSTHIKDLTKQ
jgi:hypothetical protein